ncbi:response regulator [Marinicellulosiphila megalodicopiae]|uniref:response regulator n=1 Tax=Marinicellulosiphila megalodicopiae TaxID=2724896 RepID=UPI003BB01A54
MKILVVDDHALFREGLSYVLNKIEDDVVILESENFEDALHKIENNKDISLILTDLNMPGKSGHSLLVYVTENYKHIPVVIVTASNTQREVERALQSGAKGFIPKNTTSVVMLNVLRLVLDGGIYTPHNIEKDKIALTPRQNEVLSLLRQGLSNKVIASRLNVSEGTIKMHVTTIFKILGVTNRTQAVIEANSFS